MTTFEDEFFPLTPDAYYVSDLYCDSGNNSFGYESWFHHTYPSEAPRIAGDPTFRIHSVLTAVKVEKTYENVGIILTAVKVEKTYENVGIILFRNYNNIYHVLESLNSLMRYSMHRFSYPPVIFFSPSHVDPVSLLFS